MSLVVRSIPMPLYVGLKGISTFISIDVVGCTCTSENPSLSAKILANSTYPILSAPEIWKLTGYPSFTYFWQETQQYNEQT